MAESALPSTEADELPPAGAAPPEVVAAELPAAAEVAAREVLDLSLLELLLHPVTSSAAAAVAARTAVVRRIGLLFMVFPRSREAGSVVEPMGEP
ncbi:hypothetical protein NSK11_contig00134-0020 [Nocardia seriolae]|uniref:Uncharacterized protein n=1 Tax=Nocardia seriolae TaxID=37332 RepID=A0ABC9Z2W4_9NOCA|nr:hypothetical protein NSER024013_56690 [Nocardia seriolae]GAM49938.1 hypothetical protein NS07_v2contig00129-0018 [Nocardia seriolae]GAP31951.1 hypothetical protein NSK11_contig00134-0020 [Nocardia seriolae]GEM27610.1 hypothetical protein NS2_58490 [Nocardia seriolae NBRC 15557]